MSTGKTFKLGQLKINFSNRGIAVKRGDQIWRLPFPWAQQRYQGRPAASDRYADRYRDRYDEDQGDYDGDYGYEELPWYMTTWFMWLSLIFLPPVGIWVLWRRNQFDISIRSAVSVSSLIWMVVALVMMFSGGGGQDVINTGAPIATATYAPAATATPDGDLTTSPAIDATPDLSDTPAPTPEGTVDAGFLGTEATPSPGFLETSGGEDPDATPSPTPTPERVWSNPLGKYYHSKPDCSSMKNAEFVSLAVALSRNQPPCPVCIGGEGTGGTGTPTSLVAPTYYATATGKYFHLKNNCGGMKNASKVLATTAVKHKQAACPTCVTSVFATTGGKHYHAIPTCTGMQGASRVSLTRAKADKKTPCPTCIGKVNTASPTTALLYYATKDGKYYHEKANCSGMRGAVKISLATAQSRNQPACPVCIKKTAPGITYYGTPDGKYYHIKATCTGMRNAVKVSLDAARKKGQTACPVCLKGTAVVGTPTAAATYFSTINGKYYHKTATCTGMKGADKIDLATANKRKQTACPTCLGTVATYYATRNGQYYHKTATCTGMRNASKISINTAAKNGQTACPKCLGGTPKPASTPGPGGGSSGSGGSSGATNNSQIKVWVTIEGSKYHSTKTCSGMKNAAQTNLTWALSHNYSRCTVCNAPRPVS